MFIDARSIPDGTEVRADVCVIGAGMAGLSIALEFERRGIDTVILESGGFGAGRATRDLLRGENIGLPYTFGHGSRYRAFGGSSIGWAGYCRPLSAHDLSLRDWIPDSGWPLSEDELRPYVQRAHNLLALGPADEDLGRWVAATSNKDVMRVPVSADDGVEDVLVRFSVPTSFDDRFRSLMKDARNVRVCLHADAVNLTIDSATGRIAHVDARTLGGRQFKVKVANVVLACGGIDNARMLLASNRQVPEGIGNAHDLVGRYFADHPWVVVGRVKFRQPWHTNKLYDRIFQNKTKTVSANGWYFGAQLSLTQEVQRREGLLGAYVNFASQFRGAGSLAADAWIGLGRRFRGISEGESSLISELRTLAMTPAAATTFAVARRLRLVGDVHMEVVCEPAPNPNSRITLSDKVDALGVPRARVDWRLSETEKRTIDRTAAIVSRALTRSGVADVELFSPYQGRDWPKGPVAVWRNMGSWHHMGTTRMHDSPRKGVVDRDCAVHGVGNLFVAGSSVFPTFGANFPTITIIALSIRLADHLGRMIQTGEK